ncbi:M15 family metallopeptidase [Candidatus Kaiserbacteria bacterium]|nr:M15 family metallopeptidase [Candidatus Kaiserbacteria bacterium]
MSDTVQRRFNYSSILIIVFLFGAIVSAGYLFWKTETLSAKVTSLETVQKDLEMELASTTVTLADREEFISELETELESTLDDLEDTEDDLRDEKNKNREFAGQIEDLAGTVNVLDRLSKTDKELLQKYSKVYFLNENFRPSKLTEIDKKYVYPDRQAQFFHSEAWPFLEDMLKEAKSDGVELLVTSAFRSFEEQTVLKGQYTVQYGSGANAFSADQGYSEHQLGTTVDLTTTSVGGAYTSFAQTEAFAWLAKNAYRYGFILSYPENNVHYVYEPWHWRFVGRDLAKYIHRKNIDFYDMDQREINEYLISIFD